MKTLSNILILSCLLIFAIGCKESGPKKVSGFEYTRTSDNGGRVAQPGEYAYFTMTIKDQNDSILQELKEGPQMPVLQVPVEKQEGVKANPVTDLLAILGEGDEATIIMPTDSLGQLPPNLASMDHLTYNIKVQKVMTEVEFKADAERKREEQLAEVEALKERIPEVEAMLNDDLATFKAGKSDKIKETPDGLKYIIHEEGTGRNAAAKDYVKVHYYGVLTDGTMFDNSFRAGKPFAFTLGRGEVIKGWDNGIPLLKTGGSASVYIPYTLAYGEAGSPPVIPAKADLVFYTELVEIVE